MTRKIKILREAPEEQQAKPKGPVQQISFEEDPMNYIIAKYPSLKEMLTVLMTDAFKDYITGIYVVAPRPTTFKIVLHNNQEFILEWTGKTYICKVEGKKYYLSFISDKQRATKAIAQLLELGAPIGKPGPAKEEENAPKGPEEEEGSEPGEELGGGGEEEETLEESIKKKGIIRILREAKTPVQTFKPTPASTRQAVDKLVLKYPDKFEKQSDTYRIANKAKLSPEEFTTIIKKDLKAKNIQAYPPRTGPNDSGKFNMVDFESEFGPVRLTLSGGAGANLGNAFEKSLVGDLQRVQAEGFSKKNKSSFANPDLVEKIVDEFKLKKGNFEVEDVGGLNQSRPLEMTEKGPLIGHSGKTIAETLTDITIRKKGENPYYLSLKYGGTTTFFNAGVTKVFPEKEIRAGKITNAEGVSLLNTLGIDNKTFCEVFNYYGKDRPKKSKPKQDSETEQVSANKTQLKKLIKSGIGSGYYYVQTGKGEDQFFKVDNAYANQAATITQDPQVHYGGLDGKGKRVDVTFKSAKYKFKINIRNKQGGIYPTHIMCDYVPNTSNESETAED